MDEINKSNITPNCPPPSVYEKIEILSEKYYNIKTKENEYDLIITLFQNKSNMSEKIFNFHLLLGKSYSYEKDKSTSELMKLFLLTESNEKDKEKKIFEKIEKFHTNNNVQIIHDKNSENEIDLIYILKTIDDDDIKFKIELIKTDRVIAKEKDKIELIKEIQELKRKIKTMEEKYDKIIKEQNEEIKILKDKIKSKLSINNNKKLIKEENQLIFNSDISLLNNLKIIDADIDGSRGLNDYFEIYHLNRDPNTVYIAVKCREKDGDLSYIDIFKISSIENIKKLKRLSGPQKRIVFIKYFINPYTLKEYLICGDREEKVRTWEILDENNYILLNVINTNYGRCLMQQSIYNCLLYFTQNRSYIYTTTVTNNYSRFYDLDNGAFLRDISITYYYYTLYLTTYKDYIIDCCTNFIMIYNPLNEEIYSKIENTYTKGDNRSCCVIYDKNRRDYLYISNCYGYVIVYDLIDKNNIFNFELQKDLYHIIFWDLNHLIVAQYDNTYLGVIDIDNKKTDDLIKCQSNLICVKKIKLNNKDELLFTSGENTGEIFIFYSSSKSSVNSNGLSTPKPLSNIN